MKASDLVTVWSAPDNSRLTAKQYSFRLPVHVAAKLAVLEEMYPTKSRSRLVGTFCLQQLQKSNVASLSCRDNSLTIIQTLAKSFSMTLGQVHGIKPQQQGITTSSKKRWAMKARPSFHSIDCIADCTK